MLFFLPSLLAVSSDPLMCGQNDLQGVNTTMVHYQSEGLVIFPCYAGPRTATAIGPLSVVGLVHHQPHVNDPADVLVQWADAVGNLEGVALAITAGDTLAISIAHSRVPETFPLQSKYIGIAERPRAPRDPRMSAKLIAKKKEVTAVDPVISGLLRRVTSASALDNLEYLTGITSDIKSRNSIHPDGLKAADWIANEFTKYGFTAAKETFQDDYNPNVIATLVGEVEPDTIVVVGAHYDSRGVQRSSATAGAPGANDDGSGTQLLLQLARLIFEDGISFKYTLVLGAWSGEEQGLVGSRAYAAKCKNNGDKILAMLQADMISYRKEGEGIQNGFPNRNADPILIDLVTAITSLYTPEVESCETTVCCSDHQSFTENGFSATQFFERCGAIADPMYHNIGDVIKRDGLDIDGQTLSLSKACVAAALTLLEPV